MQIDFKHHAYLIVGGVLSDLGKAPAGAELVHQCHELFGIGESRLLARLASLRSTGQRRIFVVEATRYTTEAQNALLKLFEEPPIDTHFVILHPRTSDFLPTLISRFWVTGSEEVDRTSNIKMAGQKFLGLPAATRLEEAATLLEDKQTDWSDFLAGVEESLNKVDFKKYPTEAVAAGRELARTRRLLAAGGHATKLIIEHLALSLPTML